MRHGRYLGSASVVSHLESFLSEVRSHWRVFGREVT